MVESIAFEGKVREYSVSQIDEIQQQHQLNNSPELVVYLSYSRTAISE
jgi:hypothetical protein